MGLIQLFLFQSASALIILPSVTHSKGVFIRNTKQIGTGITLLGLSGKVPRQVVLQGDSGRLLNLIFIHLGAIRRFCLKDKDSVLVMEQWDSCICFLAGVKGVCFPVYTFLGECSQPCVPGYREQKSLCHI